MELMKTRRSPSSSIRLMSSEAMELEYQTPDTCGRGSAGWGALGFWRLPQGAGPPG